jgi:hypothetical protein
MIERILCLSVFFLISSLSNAQFCNTQMQKSTEISQYILNEEGTVIDAVNLLVWDRCAYGQTYSMGQCLGAPLEFTTWRETLILADSLPNKYLPNIKELATLVERACYEPSINQTSFPDTPLALYWTNTPDGTAGESELKGRVIDFTDGSEIVRDVNRSHYIRFLNHKEIDIDNSSQ